MKNHIILITGIILALFSCKSQDSTYEEFIVPNGKIYPGPAQDVVANPGDKRIEISWPRGVDPKVMKAGIFWNNYTASEEIAITEDMDVISRIIGPIDENVYSFMIHTYDAKGNISIPTEIMGKVYGEQYRSTLNNRVLRSTVYDGLDLTLNWSVADSTETGISLTYSDTNGNTKTVSVDPSETETMLLDFDVDKPLFYSTEYMPEQTAIDKFKSDPIETMIDPVLEIPKNTWAEYTLPGDLAPYAASMSVSRTWDGVITGTGYHSLSHGDLPLPQRITFDLGVNARLTRMKFWTRDLADDIWRRGHVREFEIYGSLAPNPDGSLDNSWTLLGRFEVVNPHPEIEQPWLDANMIALARAGHEFEFVPSEFADPSTVVRYIRFNCLSTFNTALVTPVSILEITFWGRIFKVRE